jgi:hypothetical protein
MNRLCWGSRISGKVMASSRRASGGVTREATAWRIASRVASYTFIRSTISASATPNP